MFHFSTDRLAGLDSMVLKIPKVPSTLIPNHPQIGHGRRPPLGAADNLCSSDLAPRSTLFHAKEVAPSFCPLPPLPSASSLQLPSFLNVSTHSLAPDKVLEGPQWIPAFHHPNSPYVRWSSPVRRRILLPPSPLPIDPCIRSGAVAPEPWASSTFSLAQRRSGKEKLTRCWRSIKRSVKKGLEAVVSRLGKAGNLCARQDMHDDTPLPVTPSPVLAEVDGKNPRDSLASFVSSDSATLAAWLAERRADAARAIENTPGEMSVEEYELVGSWLDLPHGNEGWRCGVQDCDVHTANGSPVNKCPRGLRMAMPFDSADLLPTPSFPSGPFSVPPHSSHPLPRSFDVCSAQEARLDVEQYCWVRPRDQSMPGGWTFS